MHGGDQGDLPGFAPGDQARVEGPDHGIGPGGGERGHVQSLPHRGPTAPDGALSPEVAAVAVEGRDPDQGRQGAVGQLAQFGQFRQQDAGHHAADAGDAPEELGLFLPCGMGLQQAFNDLVQLVPFLCQP